ncbi:hypothetical protein MtrunA17_Chr6g0454721 [Medicago truncatula]|uniref:Uncharacterized protein n=1 Tax=Medicago truncatula TaxID=3880 RepID=A0A396HAD0_MEDTR|nr:hypothetical protein MtrunA17_Chr6g0454721 [Medicago truncatula]
MVAQIKDTNMYYNMLLQKSVVWVLGWFGSVAAVSSCCWLPRIAAGALGPSCHAFLMLLLVVKEPFVATFGNTADDHCAYRH